MLWWICGIVAILLLAVIIAWRIFTTADVMLTATSSIRSQDALSDVSAIDNNEAYNYFIENYYRTKDVSLVSSSMAYIDHDEAATVASMLGPTSGFYSEVFRANPDRLLGWIQEIDSLLPSAKQLFIGALWLSNSPEAKKYVEKIRTSIASNWEPITQDMIEGEPLDLATYYPQHPTDNDMLLGAFFATGKPKYLTNIIAASTNYNNREDFMVFMTAATAKWALASIAQEHNIVYTTLEAHLDSYHGDERAIISDIIAKSKLPSGPEMLNEQMEKIFAQQKAQGQWLEYLENIPKP
ncbi:MAG: hypothetical protein QNK26_13690 [Moritella sp.]|uniref:hypothetical protein n=1 Tax=Moritella sp. TaxID=78556 RepID=UPI0029B1B845|nr:hypothetical protein [Moritella sp.]MDX2321634.1 hypothetical protein [Moritella sp.]